MNPNITELRKHLLGTLEDLRNRDKPMEPDRARAIAQVADVLVDTARVEVDYLRATSQTGSEFMQSSEAKKIEGPQSTRVITHRIK